MDTRIITRLHIDYTPRIEWDGLEPIPATYRVRELPHIVSGDRNEIIDMALAEARGVNTPAVTRVGKVAGCVPFIARLVYSFDPLVVQYVALTDSMRPTGHVLDASWVEARRWANCPEPMVRQAEANVAAMASMAGDPPTRGRV